MSRHEGVSCDSCLKSNFRGRRYKCLICYDYDLCANCYEDGVTSTRHSSDHPMQCILTRSDFEIYYGGEVLSGEQPQSFTCPYCKKMGLSDAALLEHVGAEHTDTAFEVVCPVCAALPGGEPNLVTDDFAGHLTLEHRTGPRDLISFLDEPSAIRHGGVRRIPHSGRALGGPRSRRSNMHFSSSGGLSALSPSGRDSVDPIAELLSQLSGVRRGAPQPSQLQQLQMQIQLERQQVSAARQHLERLPRRQIVSSTNSSNIGGSTGISGSSNGQQQSLNGAAINGGIVGSGINIREGPIRASSPLLLTTSSSIASSLQSQQNQSQFLLARFMTPTLDEGEQAQLERDRADRSQFVQALMISTLSNVQPNKINDEEISDDMLGLTLNSKESSKKEDDNSDTETKKVQQQQNKQQSPPPPPTTAAPQSNLNEEVIEELQPSQHQQHSITSRNSNVQSTKPKQQAAGSKQQQQQQQPQSVGVGGVNERRGRPPPPQQSAKPRDLKTATAATGNNTTTMSSSKHVPDTR